MISRFFIDRPIFATVLSIVITLIGGIALLFLPIAQYPRITPPGVRVSISYPGASAQVVADTVAAPIEQQVNGVEGMLYMSSQMRQRRLLHADRHLRHRHRPEHGPGHGAEPRGPGHAAAADPGPEPGHHHPQEDARHLDDRQLLLAGRPLRRHLPEQLRHDQRQGRAAARATGVSDITYQGERDYSIRAWLDPQKLASLQHDRHRRGQRHPQPEPGRARRPDRAAARPPQARPSSCRSTPWAGSPTPEQFGDIIVKVGQRGAGLRSVNPAAAASNAVQRARLAPPRRAAVRTAPVRRPTPPRAAAQQRPVHHPAIHRTTPSSGTTTSTATIQ